MFNLLKYYRQQGLEYVLGPGFFEMSLKRYGKTPCDDTVIGDIVLLIYVERISI